MEELSKKDQKKIDSCVELSDELKDIGTFLNTLSSVVNGSSRCILGNFTEKELFEDHLEYISKVVEKVEPKVLSLFEKLKNIK